MSPSAESGAAAIARGALALTGAALLLALYIYTPSPSNDVKYLILAWAAPMLALAGFFIRGGAALPRPVLLFSGLALWLTVCAMASGYPAYSLLHASRFLGLALLAAAAAQLIGSRAQADRLFAALVGAALLASGYGLLQFFGLDPMPWDRASMSDEAYTGLPATFGNANLAAHVLALAFVLAVYLAYAARRPLLRGAYVFAAAAFLAHLLYTGQRAAPLALTAAGLWVALLALAGRKGLEARRAPRLMAGVLGVLGLAAFALLAAVRLAPEALPLDGSLLLRYNAYFGAAEMIADRPILGFGPGVYAIENTSYWTAYEQRWFAERYHLNFHVHNDLLETAVAGGLPAAVLQIGVYLAVLLYAAARALGPAGPDRAFALAMAAFFAVHLLDGFFGFNLRSPASGALFAIVLGAGSSALGAPVSPVSGKPLARRFGLGAIAAASVVALVFGTAHFRAAVLLKGGQDALARSAGDRAEPLLRRAATLAPWDWTASQLLGRALVESGRRPDAAAAYDEALRRNPNDLVSLLAAAQTRLALYGETLGTPDAADHFGRSQEALARAKALCPGLSAVAGIEGRHALIEARELASKEGGADRARAAYERARERFQAALPYAGADRGAIYMFLFQAHLGLDNDAEAAAAIGRAVDADPKRAESWNFYYAFARQTDRLKDFRAAVDRAAQRGLEALTPPAAAFAAARRDGSPRWPQAAQALAAYGSQLRQGGAPTPERVQSLAWATDELAQLVREDGDFEGRPGALYHLAAAYRALEALPQAAALAEQAYPGLEGDAKLQAALFLAERYAEGGRHGDAQRMIDDAMDLAPRQFDVWLASARTLKAAGQRGPALDRYRHILRQFSSIPAETRGVIDAEMGALQGAP